MIWNRCADALRSTVVDGSAMNHDDCSERF